MEQTELEQLKIKKQKSFDKTTSIREKLLDQVQKKHDCDRYLKLAQYYGSKGDEEKGAHFIQKAMEVDMVEGGDENDGEN